MDKRIFEPPIDREDANNFQRQNPLGKRVSESLYLGDSSLGGLSNVNIKSSELRLNRKGGGSNENAGGCR